uniref:Fibronectin type-III domain-containing protein n=1 Tax=Globisporangium ultimum (strain ATCC 200006 / CBS 805.95 / DAOM BR144) TaxID=431595 RepID=K3WF53_GLOUD
MRDVLALEAELESFSGIDDVRVSRTFTLSPTTMVYTIEFLGVSVRGKLPSLQIRDVGINGCSAFDGTPAGTVPIVSVVVQKEQLAYATIYQAPTTRPIPFDATDEDMKAALEALSSLPNVDVTRKVAKFGYDWKVTYIAFNDPRSPPTLVANGFALQAVQDPKVTVTQFNRRKLDTRAISAGGGASIFVRVAAHNKNGFGESSVPVPASIRLANQLPSEVLYPYVEVLSSSELLVQWDYPWNDGGEEVTEYKVEWWSSTLNGGAKQSYVLHHLESPRQIADVNTISISAPSAGSNTYLSGTFQVGFDGEWSSELPYDLSAVMMQSALKNLSTIEDVTVDRVLNANGYTWVITFHQAKYKGNQHKKHKSRLDPSTSHRLQVSGTNLLLCTTSLRDSCIPKLENGIMPSISIGTRQEIQALTCTGTPGAATGFKLNYMGVETALIPSNAAAADVEAALENILVAGAVSVSFSNPAQTTVCVTTNAARLLVVFDTELGDVTLLTVSGVSAGLIIPPVEELRKGRTQMTPGRMPYSFVVSGLTVSNVYNIRIAAYSSIGFGPFSVAQPVRGVIPVMTVPSAPQSLTVQTRLSSSTLLMVWEEPLSNGGSSVTSYRVEWDVNPAYTSQCGERPEVQTLVSTHTSEPAAGDKYKLLIGTDVVGCVSWKETDANLQLKVRALGGVYANAEVTRVGDGTARWDFGYTYKVTFVNPVTVTMNAFPLSIPLLSVDKLDVNCNSYQGNIVAKRATFGPGLDDKFAQGKIDSANNECSSLLNEPIAQQTITKAVALTNARSLPAIQLALAATTTSTPVGGAAAGQTTLLGAHAPILCDLCVQKLAGNTLTITSATLVGVINNGDYFIVEEVLTDTVAPSSTLPRKCVMKAAVAATTTSIIIDATDGTFLNGGCQLPIAFESKAWALKRFNMRAHVVQDLIAGRDYSVRVVTRNMQGESQAAMA